MRGVLTYSVNEEKGWKTRAKRDDKYGENERKKLDDPINLLISNSINNVQTTCTYLTLKKNKDKKEWQTITERNATFNLGFSLEVESGCR